MRFIFITLSMVAVLTGCAATKAYHSSLSPNIDIHTRAEAVDVALDVYSVDSSCHATYQGTVNLEQSHQSLAVITGKPSYLVTRFSSSSFWRASSSSMSSGLLLHARKGYRYQLNISYIDGIYSVIAKEQNLKTGRVRELNPGSLTACQQKAN